MNIRIRELGREATIWCVSQPNQDDFDAMWEEKFAELIVRECAQFIFVLDAEPISHKSAARLLQEHFGVES